MWVDQARAAHEPGDVAVVDILRADGLGKAIALRPIRHVAPKPQDGHRRRTFRVDAVGCEFIAHDFEFIRGGVAAETQSGFFHRLRCPAALVGVFLGGLGCLHEAFEDAGGHGQHIFTGFDRRPGFDFLAGPVRQFQPGFATQVFHRAFGVHPAHGLEPGDGVAAVPPAVPVVIGFTALAVLCDDQAVAVVPVSAKIMPLFAQGEILANDLLEADPFLELFKNVRHPSVQCSLLYR